MRLKKGPMMSDHESPQLHPTWYRDNHHATRFLTLAQALGFVVTLHADTSVLEFTSPTPLTDDEIQAVMWATDQMPRRVGQEPSLPAHSLDLADLVLWHQTWRTGMALAAHLDHLTPPLPAAVHVRLVAYLTAMHEAKANWILRRYAQLLLTPLVGAVWEQVEATTPDHKALLAERRDLWLAHERRYRQRQRK